MKYLLRTLYICIFFFGAQSVFAGVITQPPNNLGLVGYWSFEDATGSVATDFSGNGNDGAISGATFVNGKRGKALSLNGSSDHVTIPHSASLTVEDDITVSAWIRPEGYSLTPMVLAYNNDSFTNTLLFGFNSAGIQTAWIGGSTAAPGVVAQNEWVHVVYVFNDSANEMSYYRDGVFLETDSQTANPVFSNGEWYIGAECDSAPCPDGNYFDGTMDEVRIYNRALSASEIADLSQTGATQVNTSTRGQVTEGLVGHWTFDGRDGLTDQGSLDNDLVLNGGAKPALGKVGQAYEFNGSTDHLKAPSGTDYAFSGDFSLSGWGYLDTTSGNQVLAGKGLVGSCCATDGYQGFHLRSASGNMSFRFEAGGDAVLDTKSSGSAAVAAGEWVHYVGVKSDKLYLYINGELASTGVDDVSSLELTTDGTGTDAFGVGATQYFSNSQFWNGKADDIRVYNRALSASEAVQLYQLGESTINKTSDTGVKKSNLVAHWTFDGSDVSGSTITDVTGNGNTGTASGTDQPGIGKVGQGYDFTGAGNDAVTFSSIAFSGSATISAWVKPDDLSADGAFRTIIGNSGGDRIFISSSGDLVIRQNASNLSLSPSGVVSVGEWAHVVVTWDGSTATGYINGVVTSPTRSVASITNYNRIGIISASGEWDGAIDDVRIYNTALSASEIQQLYQVGL